MLKNTTKNTVLAKRIKYCKGISKYTGLMFSKKIKDKALVFEFKKERIALIHMFFVFFAIDLIYLDENKKIVELKKNLKPFSYYRPTNKAKYVVELMSGTIDKTKTEVGDKINFD